MTRSEHDVVQLTRVKSLRHENYLGSRKVQKQPKASKLLMTATSLRFP